MLTYSAIIIVLILAILYDGLEDKTKRSFKEGVKVAVIIICYLSIVTSIVIVSAVYKPLLATLLLVACYAALKEEFGSK